MGFCQVLGSSDATLGPGDQNGLNERTGAFLNLSNYMATVTELGTVCVCGCEGQVDACKAAATPTVWQETGAGCRGHRLSSTARTPGLTD